MSDFERAAERLRQVRLQGISEPRIALGADISEKPSGTQKNLDNLRELLQKKLSEPLDVIVTEVVATSQPSVGKDIPEQGQSESTSDTPVVTAVSPVDHPPIATKPAIGDSDRDQDKPLDYNTFPAHKKLQLSFSSLAERGFIIPGTAKGRLTEEFRRIKRPLLKHMNGATPESHLNVIMVTSSVQGEGKTYTSLNLAMSLAQEKNRSVLLIDADVVKGTAGRELGITGNEPGLLDLLAQADPHPADVVLSTNIPDFAFMPAGKDNHNANELLTSSMMRDTIDTLAKESTERVIILDCPPILQTNEANALAEYAGQIVFVVAEQQTSQSLVQEALRHLDRDKYVGMLLNKSSRVGAGYGYGYGYY